MCLANIKWNSNLLGCCFFSILGVCVGVSESWCLGIIAPADGTGCLWSVSAEILHWISPFYDEFHIRRQSWTIPELWGHLDLAEPCLSGLQLDLRATCTQRHGKFASGESGDGFWVLSLLDFFPGSSVSYPERLCGCSDRQDRDFVIRSLPSYGVPAAFHRQLSSRGWGSFAFTMLHTALNCVEKAKYCRPDAAFPLPFISLESNFTPGMALCSW